mmetsp:Transcript_14985/g.41170  ORF Transcript_14985/g.41170 Transcript_14985/m.41170 type:complete len:230 (+) Transcript_14985:1220-1909(+)
MQSMNVAVMFRAPRNALSCTRKGAAQKLSSRTTRTWSYNAPCFRSAACALFHSVSRASQRLSRLSPEALCSPTRGLYWDNRCLWMSLLGKVGNFSASGGRTSIAHVEAPKLAIHPHRTSGKLPPVQLCIHGSPRNFVSRAFQKTKLPPCTMRKKTSTTIPALTLGARTLCKKGHNRSRFVKPENNTARRRPSVLRDRFLRARPTGEGCGSGCMFCCVRFPGKPPTVALS